MLWYKVGKKREDSASVWSAVNKEGVDKANMWTISFCSLHLWETIIPRKRRKKNKTKEKENVMKMLTDDGSLNGVTVCDAGCGTGCLSIPLAKEGAVVSASDISAAMVAEAEKQVS